ncbi:MAG TPA: hypothetical protein VF458_05135 [Ktedonobacteraceae bacterium]
MPVKKGFVYSSLCPCTQKQKQRKDQVKDGIEKKGDVEKDLPESGDVPRKQHPDEPALQQKRAEKLEGELPLNCLMPQSGPSERLYESARGDLTRKKLIRLLCEIHQERKCHPTTARKNGKNGQRSRKPSRQSNQCAEAKEDNTR